MNAKLVPMAAATAVAVALACGSQPDESRDREAEAAGNYSAVVRVHQDRHQSIHSVAKGAGGVWTASVEEDGCSGYVTHVDPDRPRVVGRARVGAVADVAAGAQGVWAVGAPCGERKASVYRIDPRTDELVAAIPLDVERGGRPPSDVGEVAVGAGAVWVSVAFGVRTGEVLRIDPQTNKIDARIDARGRPGDLVAANDAVWVASDRQFTDESPGAASLHRIDPNANAIAATPVRDRLPLIGGTELLPTIAAGNEAVWLFAARGASPLAVRVDARTGQLATKPVRAFWPVAVADDGVWFAGAGLRRLNPDTSEVDRVLRTPRAVDVAFDRENDAFWIASHKPVLTRVKLP
jgi:hypothetical protein